jgi:hypothetical protein
MQKALETARRATDTVTGPGVVTTQAIHPPAAIISIAIEDEEMPPSPERPAAMHHYITCVPTASFGLANSTEKWCSDLPRGGAMHGDGTLTYNMLELTGLGWERSIQVRPCPWIPVRTISSRLPSEAAECLTECILAQQLPWLKPDAAHVAQLHPLCLTWW